MWAESFFHDYGQSSFFKFDETLIKRFHYHSLLFLLLIERETRDFLAPPTFPQFIINYYAIADADRDVTVRFSVSERPDATSALPLAVGPARVRVFPRRKGKERKKAKRRNHARSPPRSCTYAGSAPDRCRASPPPPLAKEGEFSLVSLSLTLFPSALPTRRFFFLRSEACVRVSPSFPFIAALASAHSSASPSSASS